MGEINVSAINFSKVQTKFFGIKTPQKRAILTPKIDYIRNKKVYKGKLYTITKLLLNTDMY